MLLVSWLCGAAGRWLVLALWCGYAPVGPDSVVRLGVGPGFVVRLIRVGFWMDVLD